MASVPTVGGPRDVAELGRTLMHEHVVNVTPEFARDYPHLAWPEGRAAAVDAAVRGLREVRAGGIETVVDATAFGHGRDVAFVQEVAARVEGLDILLATGLYSFGHLPFFAELRAHREPDVLTTMFLHDIEVGIAGTEVRAATIKCATDRPGMTPEVERILRACAAAHRQTGAPLTTHTVAELRNGLDQQRVFAAEGVDLSRVLIGHSGDSQDLDYLKELMDAGSTIGADRFGMYMEGFPGLEERVGTVAALCRDGYGDRIVLSHDFTYHTDWFDLDDPPFEFPAEWAPTHVAAVVVPALLEAGVEEAQVEAMLVDNPRRLFSHGGGY
jgi:phosphotriesterase-related protein